MPQSVNTLSDRDAALLRAVQDHAGPDGWARPRARAALMEAAGLTRPTWQRRSRGLVLAGLLERDPVEREGWSDLPTSYRVTAAGHDALSRRGSFEPTEPTEPRGNEPTEPRSEPPLRERLNPEPVRTKKESLSQSSGGSLSHYRATVSHGCEPRGMSHDNAPRWPHGYLTVPLSADPEENAALMAALGEFYRSRKGMKLPQSIPVPAQVVYEPPKALPNPAPSAMEPAKPDSRNGWGLIAEACQWTFQLPSDRVMGAEGAWIAIQAVPGAPTAQEVIEALRIMVPQWRAKAAETKGANPWQFVPKLKTWLREEGWKYAAPPAKAPGEDATPLLGPAEKAAIEELKKKGNTARSRGDFALANDYRDQIDRIRKTGRVA